MRRGRCPGRALLAHRQAVPGRQQASLSTLQEQMARLLEADGQARK